jgi:hypothetical protein
MSYCEYWGLSNFTKSNIQPERSWITIIARHSAEGGNMERHEENSGSNGYQGDDRRVHNNIRDRFESACLLTAPFLHAENGMNGMPMKLSAIQTLRNHYPDLSQQEIALLFSVVQNFHGMGMRR